jgi:hypothetical protein
MRWTACTVIVSLCMGCEAKKPWESTVPVAGSVTYQGKAISGAQVVLFPVDSNVHATVRPSAVSAEDGTLKFTTYAKDDGAPKGDYQVSIVWHPLVNAGNGPVRGDNQLPTRYAKPTTSQVTATVKEEGGVLPEFELKKK